MGWEEEGWTDVQLLGVEEDGGTGCVVAFRVDEELIKVLFEVVEGSVAMRIDALLRYESARGVARERCGYFDFLEGDWLLDETVVVGVILAVREGEEGVVVVVRALDGVAQGEHFVVHDRSPPLRLCRLARFPFGTHRRRSLHCCTGNRGEQGQARGVAKKRSAQLGINVNARSWK